MSALPTSLVYSGFYDIRVKSCFLLTSELILSPQSKESPRLPPCPHKKDLFLEETEKKLEVAEERHMFHEVEVLFKLVCVVCVRVRACVHRTP